MTKIRMGKPKMPSMMDKPTKPSLNKFEEFLEDLEGGILNKTFGGNRNQGSDDYDDTYGNNDYDDTNYAPIDATTKTTPKDPYKDGDELPKEMANFWDELDHGTTPLYDNDFGDESNYEAYNEYTEVLPNAISNATSDDSDYVYSAFMPRPWMSHVPEQLTNTTFNQEEDSVSYAISGYQIAHAVYIGAVVLILLANLIMILAILLQPRLRCRASTILLLNFFVIEVLLSIVDLVFTQNLLIADDPDKVNMGATMCLVGPWLLHILQAAQPVALFILNVESITTILAPERYDMKVGCRVSALLVLVTWLFGVALASIFVMRSELIETFVVIIVCFNSAGEDEPFSMHFLMGLLQLGGPIVVLIASGVTLIAVVIRRTSSPHLSADAKSRVRGSVIVLLAVSFTYVLVTLPVIIINARFIYLSIQQTTRAWITVQVIRRLGALFFPAFWWSRPDVRRSLKELPLRLLCRVQEAPPRPSVISLENDTETADLLPLELADPQQQAAETYRSV